MRFGDTSPMTVWWALTDFWIGWLQLLYQHFQLRRLQAAPAINLVRVFGAFQWKATLLFIAFAMTKWKLYALFLVPVKLEHFLSEFNICFLLVSPAGFEPTTL